MAEQTAALETQPSLDDIHFGEIDWSQFPDTKRRILIPVDGSHNCDRALHWYVENMKKEHDFIIMVHVIAPNFTYKLHGENHQLVPETDIKGKLETYSKAGQELKERYLKWSQDHQVTSKVLLYVSSHPGETIVRVAKSLPTDQILMGNRGLGTIRRAFLGSVTDYVLHHAHKPLIVVPPPEK